MQELFDFFKVDWSFYDEQTTSKSIIKGTIDGCIKYS